jgi:hypothetical protein
MSKTVLTVCILMIFLSTNAFAGSEVNFKPGKWEVTTTMKMAGGMTMPPQTFTQCMTKESIVPQNTQPGQECTVVDTKHSGNTVTWKIRCKTEQGNMDGSGKIVYSGTSFDGTMTVSMPSANMTFTSEMSGRRIGKCE